MATMAGTVKHVNLVSCGKALVRTWGPAAATARKSAASSAGATSSKAPTVVLLHNALTSSLTWTKVAPVLANSFHVVGYDRAGFGGSDPFPRWSPHYHAEGAQQLLELLDALEIEQAALVGHSDGATIALLAASMFPTRVSCVVADAPHMWYSALRPEAFDKFLQHVADDPAFIAGMKAHHRERAEEVVRRWQELWTDNHEFRSWTEAHRLNNIRKPVLAMSREHDPYYPPTHTVEICAKIPNSQACILPGESHDVYSSDSKQFLALVLPFLKQHAKVPKPRVDTSNVWFAGQSAGGSAGRQELRAFSPASRRFF